jgi:hypothetical protein
VAEGCGDDVERGEVFELRLERAMRKSRPEGPAVYEKWDASTAAADLS